MKKIVIIFLALIIFSCENRDINEGEQFRPRQVHDSFQNVEFSKVTIDGVEYLMLERDNNNPHEGFGFMAFRANNLVQKQDSIMAYLQAIGDMQSRIYAQINNLSLEESDTLYNDLLNYYLSLQVRELTALGRESLSDTTTTQIPQD